jgi:hypothetical protein
MNKIKWKDSAKCLDYDTDLFFNKYEDDEVLRPAIDNLCLGCPVANTCFAVGISQKEWGVWGGVFLELGTISKEFNKHKTKQDWANTWQSLTTDK